MLRLKFRNLNSYLMPLLKLINRGPQRCSNDDFDKVVAENHRSVYALALRLTGSVCDAEDITQEVFMKFYKSQTSFRGESKVATLLYRITYNHTIDFLRRRRVKACELNESVIALSAEDDNSAERRAQLLEHAIERLPVEDRAIITLFYMDNRSVEEISKIATISIANVKVRLHRIRKRLYTIIGEQYYE